MRCPIDNTELVMAERQGVEIDYCPTCRGVWLDRGELDKIIERSTEDAYNPCPPSRQPQYGAPNYKAEFEARKKRKGFLSDFFDFD